MAGLICITDPLHTPRVTSHASSPGFSERIFNVAARESLGTRLYMAHPLTLPRRYGPAPRTDCELYHRYFRLWLYTSCKCRPVITKLTQTLPTLRWVTVPMLLLNHLRLLLFNYGSRTERRSPLQVQLVRVYAYTRIYRTSYTTLACHLTHAQTESLLLPMLYA